MVRNLASLKSQILSDFSPEIFFILTAESKKLVLDLNRKYGNNAHQNLGIMIIINWNNKDIEFQPEME